MAGFIKVMLVDDREEVRSGLGRILSQAPGIQVVAEVSGVDEVLSCAADASPEVLLVDLNVQDAPDLGAIHRLTSAVPDLKVLVITVFAAEPSPEHLWQAGVRGFLGRGCPVGDIVRAIKAVHAGQRYPATAPARGVIRNSQADINTPIAKLLPREVQLMRLLVEGQPVQAIAEAWHLNLDSITASRQLLYQKLNISCDQDLLRLAQHHGMVVNAAG